MKYEIAWTQAALNDYETLKKSGDKATLKKLITFLEELELHPKTGTGQAEQLKYGYSGCWSRRLNRADRLIFRIDDEKKEVIILAAKDHYKG